MDIQKEREAFEKALISKRIFDKADIENYVVFYADQNKYQPSTTCTEDEVFATEWINVGWRMWCEAKKQAIPNGFVLMPIKPTETMVIAVVKEHEGEAFLPYSLYDAYVKQARIESQEQINEH